jgi:hypothetical protein
MSRKRSASLARVGAMASIIIFAALLGAPQPASARFNQQGPKLVGTGAIGPAVDQGNSVALSADGNTMIVGGPSDNNSVGAAWVFTRSLGVWSQQGAKLIPSDNTGEADFGVSISLSADGNTAVIGGSIDSGGTGAVWVFKRSGGVWTQQGPKLVGTGATGNANQGFSVAISGDGNTLIEGGPTNNGGAGAAWVFAQSGGIWTPQQAMLTGGASEVGNGQFGSSVALSGNGNTAALGAFFDNGGIGAVWVFTRSGTNWNLPGSKLTTGTGAVNTPTLAEQGFSVALSSDGNTLIEGGPGDNTKIGAAWVFTQSGGVWTQQGQKLVGSGFVGESEQGFGAGAVALSANGNTAMVGGLFDNDVAGAAWIFVRSSGVWNQVGAKLVGSGAVSAPNSGQGRSVALSADGYTAAEGGPFDNGILGAAWVFYNHAPADAHDFNGDGIADVLWRDPAGDVGVWLMNGTSILQTSVYEAVSTNWSVVGQRDFAFSDNAGLLWRDTAGDAAIWFMNGTSISSVATLSPLPTALSVVGTGDFNNDGFADILWRDNLGNLQIWFMNGDSILQIAPVGNVPTQWVVAGADMNGDIFWRNTTTGEVGMWVMNGSQVAQAVDFGVVPLTWTIVGIGDFAGSQSNSILWRDNLGNVGMWLMNGTSIVSNKVLGNVPLNWSPALTGDFNGDGTSDILWIDTVGDVGAWFMNGTTVLSVTTYGNIGTAWTAQSLNAE